ncbi:MAG TPA: methyltransferase domain-containing protein [Anaeromyxobacteraceae bacterium]|nr:methyltransferase domain-containing protein [Anaeromyxobacteraceae bacterium]
MRPEGPVIRVSRRTPAGTRPPPSWRCSRESALAHRLFDGLEGIEIGGSAHNPFGLKTRNVDYTDDMTTEFKLEEERNCGRSLPVDIVAPGDRLPLPDESVDFVVSSHVLEHFFDPIGALQEWYRVVRPSGCIFTIVPHKERTFDRDRPRTTLAELVDRHQGRVKMAEGVDLHTHHSVWITEDAVELVRHLGWKLVAVQDRDDKVGNGFTFVVQKV